MNRIVQSEEEDSKVTRVKLGRINFPRCRCAGRVLFIAESRAETHDGECKPCTMEAQGLRIT